MGEDRERKTRGFPFLLTNHARTPWRPPFKLGRDTWNIVWKTKSRPFLGQSGKHLKTSLPSLHTCNFGTARGFLSKTYAQLDHIQLGRWNGNPIKSLKQMDKRVEHLWKQQQISRCLFHIHCYEQQTEASDSDACMRKQTNKILYLCTQVNEREVGVYENQRIFVLHKNSSERERVVYYIHA